MDTSSNFPLFSVHLHSEESQNKNLGLKLFPEKNFLKLFFFWRQRISKFYIPSNSSLALSMHFKALALLVIYSR
jgi:hypothetical protein